MYLGGRCADEFGQGVQLVPPADAEIAERIAAAPPASDIPLDSGYGVIGEDVIDAYVTETARLVPSMYSRDLKIVYTAMHGVGTPIMRRIFRAAAGIAPDNGGKKLCGLRFKPIGQAGAGQALGRHRSGQVKPQR